MDIILAANLRYLRAYYEWDDKDMADVMRIVEGSEEGARFYVVLAAAHRAGYEQTAENNYIPLLAWLPEKGLGDPFRNDADLAALESMAIEPRRAA